MLANYLFSKYKDRYYLQNTGSVPLVYSLQQRESCDVTYMEVLSGEILLNEEEEIVIPEDGVYNLILTRGADIANISIKYYLRLQKELIYNTIKAICTETTGCLDCNEDADKAETALFSQLLGYQFLVKPTTEDYCNGNCLFDKFLYQALEQNSCDLSSKIYTDLTKQLYSGKVEADKTTLKIFASIYFSAFYYFEKLMAKDTEEKVYVNRKFSWDFTNGCMRKHINCFSDMESIFKLTSQTCNEAPTVGSVIKEFFDIEYTEDDVVYQFTKEDFTANFSDPNGDLPGVVKLLNDAFRGKLYFNNTQINGEGFTFPISSVGNLTYRFVIEESTPQFDKFFFQISDTNPTPKFSNMATISIAVQEYINKPPVEVGNNTVTLANRAVKVFDVPFFTSQTVPPYADPENDPIDALRIDTLPASGVLKLNGTACFVGQVITASQIAAGQFTYTSPDQNSQISADWNFSLRDTGSMTFVS